MKTKTKVGIILLDGVGDVAYSHLGMKTPLQSAKIPNMDLLAKNGITGMMDPFDIGSACGTDTAHLSLFGYNPLTSYAGRGCFECMGAGLLLDVGDIGFKSNFSTIDEESGIVMNRRCSRKFEEEGAILCKHLDNLNIPGFPEYQLRIKYATEHRCGVRIRGPNLSNKITGTDPLKDNLPLLRCKPTLQEDEDGYESALLTSKIVNAASDEIRKKVKLHEVNLDRKKKGKGIANVILLRGAGILLKVKSFRDKYKMNGFMIAPTCIVSGFGMNLGIDKIKVEGATGDVHSNYDNKGKAFLREIGKDKYDFGFLHVKGVDDSSHEGEVEMKIELIEKVDKMLGNILIKGLQEMKNTRTILVICGDHSTPCSWKDHSYEPVPILMATIGFEKKICDDVEYYNEIDCAKGFLGRFSGMELFKTILDLKKV